MLKYATSPVWTETVLGDFDRFLLDHAACEKKASSMAMSMVPHYPDKPDLIRAMIDLAIEELSHYRDVFRIISQRKLQLVADTKDPYIFAFRRHIRHGREAYLLDQLLVAAIVEARGHERFGLIAEALPEGQLKRFYQAITSSEARHFQVFIDLTNSYTNTTKVEQRLAELLGIEAEITAALPIRAALH